MAALLSQESQQFLEYYNSLPRVDYDTDPPVEIIREMIENGAQASVGDWVFDGESEDRVVTAKNRKVPISIIRAAGRETYDNVMVYFHGGGWSWGSRSTHKAFCEMIAHTCQCVVVNVEYGLAPENKYPACHLDAQAITQWCLDNRKELSRGNDKCIVGVAGDSAGGNMSASVCHEVRGLAYQILLYPSLDLKYGKYISADIYGEGHLLNNKLMQWFRRQFLTNPEIEELEPLGSPIKRTSFAGLPPALFIVAECDPLADQSSAYKLKLDSAGVPTDYLCLQGTLHGFCNKHVYFKDTTDKTLKKMEEFCRSKL